MIEIKPLFRPYGQQLIYCIGVNMQKKKMKMRAKHEKCFIQTIYQAMYYEK